MSAAKHPSRSQLGSRSKSKGATVAMEETLPLVTPAILCHPAVQPLAWKDRPALIEHLFPAQQVSIEAQTERKAGAGQTLTALGSYWKGRKPLVLVRACVLGSLLPATGDSERDLEIFELLMAMDDDAFRRRMKSVSKEDVVRFAPTELRSQLLDEENGWKVRGEEKQRLLSEVLLHMSYADRLDRRSLRPEELPESAYAGIWDRVNAHLGTSAHSHAELIQQLGILRYGHRPKVADPFCGGGSIPFEAARLGCDVYASDLNPIACMLTWGAFHIIGADEKTRTDITRTKVAVMTAVDAEITRLGVEHDTQGNRAKAYYYCTEAILDDGWRVPVSQTWLISAKDNTIARLTPDKANRRFQIDIESGATAQEVRAARLGTLQDGHVVFSVGKEEHRISVKTLRGDRRVSGAWKTDLRPWTKRDIEPTPADKFQERLYCIQWSRPNGDVFFAAPTERDLASEKKIAKLVRSNLDSLQSDGLLPDMPIEPGDKTEEPIRTRGWTHWHHLFTPRQLHMLALYRREIQRLHSGIAAAAESVLLAAALNRQAKLCRLDVDNGVGRHPKLSDVFTNQALNTLFNFGTRSHDYLKNITNADLPKVEIPSGIYTSVETRPAADIDAKADLFITDPPYADAVHYQEITEFFIAWLRRKPPEPFQSWVWDSRRDLSVRGSGEGFRHAMVKAYGAFAQHMPDNGLQIVMFTHQNAEVWGDMAGIFWAAGLRVTAAWYIATETTSELKKGGYVQGTVILVLRKRLAEASIYKDELSIEIRQEVERQIKTLTGLSQRVRSHGRSENLFNDADLQMAGYAAALRVLTGYTNIEGTDMTAEALRPRQDGEQTLVHEFISFAAQVANEELIPDGLEPSVWETLNGSERFYLRMLDMEFRGEKKLDNYQNFAKAFRVEKWQPLMASEKPNDARLKSAAEFRRSEFSGSEFGQSLLRAILYALYELQAENQDERDAEDVLSHLRDNASGNQHETQNYYRRRQDILAITKYLSQKLTTLRSDEASAARVLNGLVSNEKLGA